MLIACRQCLKEKDKTEFYLKSKKGETPERREKVCKSCKKRKRKKTQARVHQPPMPSQRICLQNSEIDRQEEILSFFLRLRSWRDEGEGKLSNQSQFDNFQY